MASEFYHKTSALYEDFRERELHYLNTERSYNRDRGFQNNERNLPLEQYLQKIIAREQKTEQDYSITMKKFEELDQQAEMMQMKIDKLQLLKKSLSGVQVLASQHSSEIASNLKFYFASNEGTSAVDNKNNSVEIFSSKCAELHSHSTQTDLLICPNCKEKIFLQNFKHIENMIPTNTCEKSPFIQPVNEHNAKRIHYGDLKELQDDIPSSKQIIAIVNTNEALNQNNSFVNNSNEIRTLKGDVLIEDTILPSIISNSVSYEQRNASSDGSKNKSDDESMNHEFDFLDSDSKGLPDKNYSAEYQPDVKDNQSNSAVLNSNEQAVPTKSSLDEIPKTLPNSVQKIKNSKTTIPVPARRKSSSSKVDPGLREENQLAKNVTAINVSSQGGKAPKSINIKKGKEKMKNSARLSVEYEKNSSVTDTEESSSEKNVPITSTAAYQVLLGKATATQKVVHNRMTSDTDSEDEVENALSRAIKKKDIMIVENSVDQKVEEKKKIAPKADTVDLKDSSRRPSQVLTTKPPSKLSKNTRKVLGFDTSSGSEMELEIHPKDPIKEDSDEFDFYD